MLQKERISQAVSLYFLFGLHVIKIHNDRYDLEGIKFQIKYERVNGMTK